MNMAVLPTGADELGALAAEKAKFGEIYVCIAAYNDQREIRSVVRQALGYCGNAMVCDDGSTDGTFTEAVEAGALVIRHKTKLGKGRSVSDLVKEVSRRAPSGVVVMEEEGFAHVGDIPALLDPIVKDEADVTVGMGATTGVAAFSTGLMAMNSKALTALTGKGFFSEVESLQQLTMAAAADLRFKAVPLETKGAPSARSGSLGAWSRFTRSIIQRDFLAMGIPAIAFTAAGLWLLVEFLITYNYTGQIPVPQGVRGVIGLISLIFGMAFMVSYAVAYSVKYASERKME